MRVLETKLFSLDELSEDSKQVAIERNREINTDFCDWHEPIIEGFLESIPQQGFDADNIVYSGFWSQGDGAMFEYTLNDTILKKFIHSLDLDNETKLLAEVSFVCSGGGKHRGNYYHSNCCSHNIYLESCTPYEDETTELADKYQEAFEEFVVTLYQELCQTIYDALETYYYELQEDGNVIEAIMANDLEFTEDGERFPIG